MKIGKYLIGKYTGELGTPFIWAWDDGLYSPLFGFFIRESFVGIWQASAMEDVVTALDVPLREMDEDIAKLDTHPPVSKQFLPREGFQHDQDRLAKQEHLMKSSTFKVVQ